MHIGHASCFRTSRARCACGSSLTFGKRMKTPRSSLLFAILSALTWSPLACILIPLLFQKALKSPWLEIYIGTTTIAAFAIWILYRNSNRRSEEVSSVLAKVVLGWFLLGALWQFSSGKL